MDTTTAKDLLDLWLAGGNIPDPKTFKPTDREPILQVQISARSGEPVYAFGVQEVFTGLTGLPLREVTIWSWQWYIDEEQALEIVNFKRFLQSAECSDWLREPPPPFEVAAKETMFAIRTHHPLRGRPINVCRVLKQTGFTYEWTICKEADACGILHETFLKLSCLREPTYSVDLAEREKPFAVPEIRKEVITMCPHCHQAVFRFGAYGHGHDWHSLRFGWHLNRDDAKRAQEQAQERVQFLIDRDNEEIERQAANAISTEIFRAADVLFRSARYRHLQSVVKPELVEAFTQEFGGCQDIQTEEGMAEYARLEAATRALAGAIDSEYEGRLAFVQEHDLVQKLDRLLADHLTMCPVCKTPVDPDDRIAWLTDLLVLREARMPCACPEKGWRISSRDKETKPPLVEEVVGFIKARWEIPTIVVHEYGGFPPKGIELARIRCADEVVVRIALAVWNIEVVRPCLTVDPEALARAKAKPVLEQVWTKTSARLQEARIGELEAESRSGQVLKLHLSWDEQHRNWRAFRREQGVSVVYAADPYCAQEARVQEGWYYCSVMSEPERARKPTFRLVIVRPIFSVPSKHVPRDASRR